MEHIDALQKSLNALQNTIKEIKKKMHDDMKYDVISRYFRRNFRRFKMLLNT